MGKLFEEVTAAEGLDIYRRWQRREDGNDRLDMAAWQQRNIANGDPECEKLIAALEASWLATDGREEEKGR